MTDSLAGVTGAWDECASTNKQADKITTFNEM